MLKRVLFTFIIIIVFISAIYFGYDFYYNRELRQIENELNEIENVEVKNIWGHEDLTLEEISARIYIKNKGEIVLNNLSKDVYNYPNRIEISEIGGLSFTNFSCVNSIGIGSSIDVGKNSKLGKLIGKEFKTVKDVINNYDLILKTLKNLKQTPELNYFESKNEEKYLIIQKEKSKDKDPIFNLIGVKNAFEFAKTLKWKNCNCKKI